MMSIETALRDFEIELVRDNRSAHYAKAQARRIRSVCKELRTEALADLCEEHVRHVLARMKLGARTRYDHAVAMRKIGRWLHDTGRATGNSLSRLRLPPRFDFDDASLPRILTLTECRRLSAHLSALSNPHEQKCGLRTYERKLLYGTVLKGGIRPSEVMDLRCDDVHSASSPPYLSIRTEKQKCDDRVPLPDYLASALREYVAHPRSNGRLFPVLAARFLTPALRADLQDAGLECGEVTFHTLRRTAIHLWLTEDQLPMETVRRLARLRWLPSSHAHLWRHSLLTEGDRNLLNRGPSLFVYDHDSGRR